MEDVPEKSEPSDDEETEEEAHPDDCDDDMEAEDVRKKSEPSNDKESGEVEELWEEKAIESVGNEPLAMTEDDSDQEENYAMPSRSEKPDQNPFAHWEMNT